MKRWNRVFVVSVVILVTIFLGNTLLFAQAGTGKPSKEEVMQKTQRLLIPFIANKGQSDEKVKFYANTFCGTVFVTKEGEIVYALPKAEKSEDRRQATGSSGQQSAVSIQECSGEWHSPNWIPPIKRVTHPLIPSREGKSETHPHPLLLEGSIGYLTDVSLLEGRSETHPRPLLIEGRSGVATKEDVSPLPLRERDRVRGISLKEELVGAKVKAIQGEDPSVTKVSYFKGNDPSKWKTNISTYDAVNLGEVYKGISLKLKAYGNNVEKLFCVKPGADPEQIKIRLSGLKDCGVQNSEITHPLVPSREGMNQKSETCGERSRTIQNPKLHINNAGELVAETGLGPVKFTKPIAYQEIDGKKQGVAVEYMVAACEVRSIPLYQEGQGVCEALNTNPLPDIHNCSLTYGFKVASYDKTKELVIDPLLASTFLGGSYDDKATSIAIDSDGDVFVTGHTLSSDFPTILGVYDTSNNDGDAFVSKLDGDLTTLLASTFLGGSNNDGAWSIAIDSSGNVFVTGDTRSSDFPTTPGAYDTSLNGYQDVFVSRLNGDLTNLISSTFLGGTSASADSEWANTITIDAEGDVFVAGYTLSSDFPTTLGAYDNSHNSDVDAFVSKLDGDLTTLLASTFLGGSSVDRANTITTDAEGDVFVAGYTLSSDFPTTLGTYDNSHNSVEDAFVSKLDGDLTTLLASTFLGGSSVDNALSITTNSIGDIFIAGNTSSSGFPTTPGAYDTSHNGSQDAFVSKLNGDLTTLLASTFLGGSNVDDALSHSIAITSIGDVIIAGYTTSSDFPTTLGAYDTSHNGVEDAFVSKFNADLTSLLASTFIGGSGTDRAYAIATNSGGNVFIAGYTWSFGSPDFPTTVGAYDTSFNGTSVLSDAFVSKFDSNLSSLVTCDTATAISAPDSVTVTQGSTTEVTVTVTGAHGCAVTDDKVNASSNHSSKATVSPSMATTGANGQATFTITGKKNGSANVRFNEASANLNTQVKVKVTK